MARIDLYWLPLGAGGTVVRRCGRAYERLVARRDHRAPQDLYHAALVVDLDDVTYAVEVGPVWNVRATDRGVVREGPVGARWLARSRLFRYEVRCWAGGSIPDLADAVGPPVVVARDRERVIGVLQALPRVPGLTWGRDELGTGDMWNSNSVVSWALARAGCRTAGVQPPRGGRAPGWAAGLVLARREVRRAADL